MLIPPSDILSSIFASAFANIVSGDEAKPGMFPYQARTISPDGNCGGVVLTTLHILTAAHCVSFFKDSPNSITVIAGDHDQSIVEKNEQNRFVAQVIPHPEYNPVQLTSDLAILQLTEPLTFNEFVGRIALPPHRTKFKGLCVKSGWGSTGSDYPDRLRFAVLPIVPLQACREALKDTEAVINERIICAGMPLRGTCYGDSGGPMVCRNPITKKPNLCGITTSHVECKKAQYPGLNVDISYFSQWIRETMSLPPNSTTASSTEKEARRVENFAGENIVPSTYPQSTTDYMSTTRQELTTPATMTITTDTFSTHDSDSTTISTSSPTTVPNLTKTTPTTWNYGSKDDNENEKNEFICSNGTYPPGEIPGLVTPCDGIRDCLSWEDELNCHTSYIFSCGHGKYTSRLNVCNGYLDCPGGQDEANCNDTIQMKSSFICDTGKVINVNNRCDQFPDCFVGDNSDEVDCGNMRPTWFLCGSGLFIRYSWVCDKGIDCGDGSDEANCTWDTCPDGTTIATWKLCDGTNICGDWWDEINCTRANGQPTTYQCPDGELVSFQAECNSRNDCGDWSDEINCTRADGSSTIFQCQDGNFTAIYNKCNGLVNCEDGSDETNCTDIEGNPTLFQCNNGNYFAIRSKCDGFDDCGDLTDEMNCTDIQGNPFYFRCENGNYIRFSYVGDSDNDCGDWSDEVNKTDGNGNPTIFNCKNNEVVKFRAKCNELNDCGDWSDEFNCTTADGNPTIFSCRNGSLIVFSSKCNGVNNCGDWWDEEGCRSSDGILTIFHCFTQKIISFYRKCDGIDNCGDNSDEVNCDTGAQLVLTFRKCDPFEFTCTLTANVSRRCISYEKRCDGKYQCGHGEDEIGCGPPLPRSLCWGRLTCRMVTPYIGYCPPTSFVCDGMEQCVDGRDEIGCGNISFTTPMTTTTMPPFDRLNCSFGELSCSSMPKCVPVHFICDKEADCIGGEDESNCPSLFSPVARENCTIHQFSCPSLGTCIPLDWVCDKHFDCLNKEDELGCDESNNEIIPELTPSSLWRND